MYTCPHTTGPIQLWQFLLELLHDGARRSCIRWTGNSREFQLCDPKEVSQFPRPAKFRPGLPVFAISTLPSARPRPQPRLHLLPAAPRLTPLQTDRNPAPAPPIHRLAPPSPTLSRPFGLSLGSSLGGAAVG